MRIILEGPDNSGKTSLANRWKHALGPEIDYFHPGGRPDNVEAEVECIEDQLRFLQSHSVVLDRCTPISQRIYNPDPQLDGWRAHMWKRYVDRGVIVIYCRPSTDRLLRVQDLTWREGETEEHKNKIISGQHTFMMRYDALMQNIPNISYDFEDTAHADIIYQKGFQAFCGDKDAETWFHQLINYRV